MMMRFQNKEKNKNTLDSLAKALASRENTNINTGTVTAPQSGYSDDNLPKGIDSLASNGLKLGKSIFDVYSNKGNTGDLGTFGSAANNYISGNGGESFGIFGDAANNSINGSTSYGTIGDAANSAIMADSGSMLGNVAPYGGMIMGGVRAGMKGLKGGDWKDEVPQSFFGIDSEGSDVSQTISGAGQGAMMGAPFGPIGMAIGALLGTGASFLDDI